MNNITVKQHDANSNYTNGKKYLIISPRISLLPFPENIKHYGYLPIIPMGIAYVSACIKEVHNDIYNLNLELESKDVDEAIADLIKKYSIDVVMTGGMSGQFTKIRQVVTAVKNINNNITVIVGGGVITSAPKTAMDAFENVDIGVIGEGELTAPELVQKLNSNSDLSDVEGIIFKKNGNYLQTPPRASITDLDNLPYPDYEGVGCNKLWKILPTSYIVPSRSCPFHCTFCYHPCGDIYRTRSNDSVIEEITYLNKKYNISYFGLFDELFVIKRSKVLDFCKKVKPLNIFWSCTVHVNTYQPDLLEIMRESGCRHINIGVESASEKVLKSMKKNTKIKNIDIALKKIRDAKIGVNAALIFGDVVEDVETVEESLDWRRKNLQYQVELSRIYVYPGSQIYNYAVDKKIIKNEVEHLKNDCMNTNISKLSQQQYNSMLLKLTTEEAFYTYAPKSFSIISVNTYEQKTSAEYECYCGYKGKIETSGILLSNGFQCPKCIQGYSLPYYEKYSFPLIRKKIEKIIKTHGQIAFWGMGREMQLLLRGIDVASIHDTFLVDIDSKKQGLSFLNKKIESPEVIMANNIDAVIPSPLLVGGIHYSTTIETEISKLSYAEIISFGELLENGYDI